MPCQHFAKGAFSKMLAGSVLPCGHRPHDPTHAAGHCLRRQGARCAPMHCCWAVPPPALPPLAARSGAAAPAPCMILPGLSQPLPGYRLLSLRKGAGSSPAALAGASLRQLGKGSLRLLGWLLPMLWRLRFRGRAVGVNGLSWWPLLPPVGIAVGKMRHFPQLWYISGLAACHLMPCVVLYQR